MFCGRGGGEKGVRRQPFLKITEHSFQEKKNTGAKTREKYITRSEKGERLNINQ